jgi:GAF domain-containing protein/HAMP domain-containing protein
MYKTDQSPSENPQPKESILARLLQSLSSRFGIPSLRVRIILLFLLVSLVTGIPLILARNLATPALVLVVILVIFTMIILSILLSGTITHPITQITKIAQKITTGDLSIQAQETPDELGLLAHAINRMTAELRRMMVNMEQMVAQRTTELARVSEQMRKRAIQLQSITEVAHAITSVQDLDILLQQVTELISKNFGFYHVGIFLLENNGEFAALKASNSEGGQLLRRKGHQIKVSEESIVGNAIEKGIPRLVQNVSSDPAYPFQPELSATRSEAALPLRVGDRVIGALDVHNLEPAAFKEEDVALLNTLANQVAIAIENTRLFTETRSALAEAQILHRQYLRQAWSEAVTERRRNGYEYANGRLSPITDQGQEDIWKAIEEGKIIHLGKSEGDTRLEEQPGSRALIIPISVRGQVIGMYNLGEPEETRLWSEEEINLVKTVADQVGLAIENARLLEETQRRAEREHMVSDITTKLRASNDPQVILQTAVQELRQALRAKRAQVITQPDAESGNLLTTKVAPKAVHQEISQPDTTTEPGGNR